MARLARPPPWRILETGRYRQFESAERVCRWVPICGADIAQHGFAQSGRGSQVQLFDACRCEIGPNEGYRRVNVARFLGCHAAS